jgi:hypothetical protein
VPLLMEGIALTGAWVDKERGLLSLIALELGVSSRLVAHLQPGARVVIEGLPGAQKLDLVGKRGVVVRHALGACGWIRREPGAYLWLMVIMEMVKEFTSGEALTAHPHKVVRWFDLFDPDIIG